MSGHGDLLSITAGILLAVVAKVAGWLGEAQLMSHAMEVFAFGLLGGVGGWCGRVMVTTAAERWKIRRIKKQNNNNQR